LLCTASLCYAQPFTRQIDAIPVTIGGVAVSQPFAGGVNAPKHEFADIDSDGDLDLFIADNDNNIDYYRNDGTSQTADFKLCRNCITLPPFLFWFLFVDLNGDGKLDLCTDDSTNGVRYYRNDGTVQNQNFTLEISRMLDSAGNPMNAGFSSIPDFVDIDGDSLIDFLSSNSLDGSVNFYKNIGTTSSPLFKFVTGSFEGITVIGDTCISLGLQKKALHGAGALHFADVDGNGTNDMFYGDLFSHGVFFMQNTGTSTEPNLVCNTNRYPDPSLETIGFNQPSLKDIDDDGDLDLFVGVLNNMDRRGFWFYRNNGTPSLPSFQFVTKDYLSTIDVGANAQPALVDIDSNGTLDMFIGSLDGALWYFKNVGTPSMPSFDIVDTMFAGISGNYTYAPVFVDIDADSDKDLFVGRFDGRIKFYRNDGSSTPPQFIAVASPVDTINVLQNAVPTFVDYEGDGDMDLFVGKANGQISFYVNNGDAVNFQPVFIEANFIGVDVGDNSKPAFADIDNDGDPDFFVGNSDGGIARYEFVGPRNIPVFTLRDTHFADTDPLREASPAFADIDTDGDLDLFVGSSKGGLHFYRNDLMTGVEYSPVIPTSITLAQNYPNPFNPTTNIEYQTSSIGFVSLKVLDIFGRQIAVLVDEPQPMGRYKITWDGGNFPSGVYYYRLLTNNSMVIQKMLLLK